MGDTVQSMNSAQTVFREGILTQAQKLVGSEVLTKVHMLFLQIHSRQHAPPRLAEAAAGVEFFFSPPASKTKSLSSKSA